MTPKIEITTEIKTITVRIPMTCRDDDRRNKERRRKGREGRTHVLAANSLDDIIRWGP